MKAYKFKLYSNHGNRELHKTIEGHASVWNHCVALHRRYYGLYGKYISKFRLMQHIGNLKKTRRFAHWNQLPSQAVQDVVARIDKGYKAMFEARAKGSGGVVPLSSHAADTNRSHSPKPGGNCCRIIVSKSTNAFTAISSPVIFVAIRNVAPSSGMPLVMSISVC